MIRLLASAVIGLLANAVALVVGDAVLEDMEVTLSGFIIAVVVFTVVGVLAEPLLRQIAFKQSPALIGSTALISTLVGLIVTVLLTDGLQIRGATTWVLATVIVWIVSLGAQFLLPLVIFKKVMAERRAAG